MLKIRASVFVIVCIALSRANLDELKPLFESLHKTCVSATGISEDVVARAQKGDFVNEEEVGCYMRCVIVEMGLFNEGKLDIERAINSVPEEIKTELAPVIRKCGVLVGANECQTAFLMCKCVFEENPSLYMLA
nr:odorant binding protein [Semanotus bifasciatus]